MSSPWFVCGLILIAGQTAADKSNDFLPPVPVQGGGLPLDIEHVGHAAPFIGDFFEDGGLALMVGQFYDGRLRIYKNLGTRTQPRFDSCTWFEAGGRIAGVPVG
jgi:hypothetical protein